MKKYFLVISFIFISGCANFPGEFSDADNCPEGDLIIHFVAPSVIASEQRKRCRDGKMKYCGGKGIKLKAWIIYSKNEAWVAAGMRDSFLDARHEVAHYCGHKHT